MVDPIVERVRETLLARSQIGLVKYGVGTDRPDLSTIDWLIHAQEEALDLAVYLERVIQDLEATEGVESSRDKQPADNVGNRK